MSLFTKNKYYVAAGRCQLNTVRNCLGTGKVRTAADIAIFCGIKKIKVLLHLAFLVKNEEAVKVDGKPDTFVGVEGEGRQLSGYISLL